MILDGVFGIVDEGDIFLLKGTKMCMILHIVALSPGSVSFQIRGLEYKNETYCHLVELRAIDTMCDTLKSSNLFESILMTMGFTGGMWDICSLDVELPMYDVSNILLSHVINTTTTQNITAWIKYSVVYYISQNINLLHWIP